MKSENVKIADHIDSPHAKEESVKKPPVRNYWRILSFGTRLEHGILLLAIASAAASGVALPLMNVVFGRLVGNFDTYFIPGSQTTEAQFKASVAQNALYFVYLFIGKFVLSYIGMFCFRTVGLRLSASLRLSYLRALFAQPIKKVDEVSTGTVANTITSSANAIQLSVSDQLSTLFQSLSLIIAAFAIAFTYSWALTLATSSGILFLLIFYSITTPPALKSIRRLDEVDEKHATVAAETVRSIRTVLALVAEEKMIGRYDRWVNESYKYGITMGRWTALQLPPMYATLYCSYALAFWFGLKLYREGHIDSVGTVIIVFFSVLIVTSVLGSVVHPLLYVQKAISASVPIFDMIDSERVQATGMREPAVSAYGDVELKDITFAYPTRPGVEVLKGFNVVFRKGKTTALVGPSGSGKSTIVALLERWYTLDTTTPLLNETSSKAYRQFPIDAENGNESKVVAENRGSIVVDGYNISKFDLKWWRTQIGLVQQEPFLFNDTIEKNVSYGLIGTVWEDAEPEKKLELVKVACQEAFADEFISKLPKAYSSRVGEGGVKLSGGQRQRIAIARSIVRQPAILVLDEATSAIDVRGEKIVQAALDRASQNRTTIVIAHRLSTIRKADHIVVLRAGQKFEEGSHSELMSIDDGLYHGLVRAQVIEEETFGEEENLKTAQTTIEPVRTHTSRESAQIFPSVKSGVDVSDSAAVEKVLPPAAYQKKGIFGTVGVLLYEQRSKWPFFGLVAFAAMGIGAGFALQSWFFAQLVQTFQFTGQRLVDAANFWSLMFFILALAMAVCYAILALSSVMISTHVGASCRKQYFRSTLAMPIVYFDRDENSSGSIVQRLSGDPKQVIELLGLNSAFPLISIFNVAGCVIISFYFGWKLTLVTFFSVTPIIIGSSFIRMRYEVQFEKLNAEVFASSSQFATEAVGAIRTVSSLTMEDVIIDRYQKLLYDQVKISTRKASYAMLVYALTDSIELCGMALTFWYGGQLLASREYQPLQFFVIYAAIIQGAQAAGQYLSITPNLAYATASGNRILELRSRLAKSSRTIQTTQSCGSGQGAKIEFKNVNFQYPGIDTPLFTNLNISIEAGQFVAFVGPSGCGKTTIVSLLERFYDPSAGTITFDDEDIATQEAALYRKNIALVSQEPRLFSGTIRQNLVIGIDETTVSEQQIEQACRNAEIYDFIASLPDGFATELGQNTSTALSGGQKQRLCLARALLRRPQLLLLDEATSSLDSQSEKLVQGAIERLAGQRSMTVVAVAHRLATIQKASVIFVFGERDTEARKGSKIVERGSHNDLLARRGVYYSMCQAQALDQ